MRGGNELLTDLIVDSMRASSVSAAMSAAVFVSVASDGIRPKCSFASSFLVKLDR